MKPRADVSTTLSGKISLIYGTDISNVRRVFLLDFDTSTSLHDATPPAVALAMQGVTFDQRSHQLYFYTPAQSYPSKFSSALLQAQLPPLCTMSVQQQLVVFDFDWFVAQMPYSNS
jgi:hypothetical protein